MMIFVFLSANIPAWTVLMVVHLIALLALLAMSFLMESVSNLIAVRLAPVATVLLDMA